jgi:hypothetical protein
MTRSVKRSQPFPWWEPAAPPCTVSEVFNNSTPCVAHADRLPLDGSGQPTSAVSSEKMFFSDGGRRNIVAHRERQAMGLAGAVVGILAQDHHPQVGVGREVEGGEHLSAGRVHRPANPLGIDKGHQLGPIGGL